jgi:hypothetical protein
MEATSEKSPRLSRYRLAGSPDHCFLPTCRKPFSSTCVHGQDGHYYCSEGCTATARQMGLAAIQELRRKRA